MSDTNATQPDETLQIVDEVKAALAIEIADREGFVDPVSDYRVAKALGVTRATVSKWRQDKGGMSDATALRAAAITGADPVYYLLRVAMERTESIGAADVLERVVKKVRRSGRAVITAKIASILFGTVLVAGSAALPHSTPCSDGPATAARWSVYYVKLLVAAVAKLVRWLGTPFCGRNLPPLTHGIVTAPAF